MWWGNQYLELQEWDIFINLNKTRILAIMMLVPNNNTQGYKENVIQFLECFVGEGVTIIDWTENMILYVSGIEKSYK